MKRFISFLLSLAVVFGLVTSIDLQSGTALAASPSTTVYTGSLVYASHPYDEYKVYADAGDLVDIVMDCTGEKTLDPYLQMLTAGVSPSTANDGGSPGCKAGSRSAPPAYSDPGPTNGARITFTAPTSRFYFFRARSYDYITGFKSTGNGDYTLTVKVNGGVVVPPPDADGDGVPDTSDLCLNTPPGTAVDASGCPLPPPDADSDGVPDSSDLCPATPAGTAVDSVGCPVVEETPDSDGDGVPDSSDLCPETVEGITVDETGCENNSDNTETEENQESPTPAEGEVPAPAAPVVVEPIVIAAPPPGCDMSIQMPEGAAVGRFVADTPLYWMPAPHAEIDMKLYAGQTAWVFGLDATGEYFEILLQCQLLWVPADSMEPNHDATWNGAPLPATVVG